MNFQLTIVILVPSEQLKKKKREKEKSISALQNKLISNQFYTAKLENVQPVTCAF